MNMIESFIMNVDEKSSLINNKKKNGIVDTDLKLLNFMLDSEEGEDEEEGQVAKERDHDEETPHFNHESQDLFHFKKKKKESGHKEAIKH
jgi:hypothetical protein